MRSGRLARLLVFVSFFVFAASAAQATLLYGSSSSAEAFGFDVTTGTLANTFNTALSPGAGLALEPFNAVTPVPEPGNLALFAVVIAGMAFTRRRRSA